MTHLPLTEHIARHKVLEHCHGDVQDAGRFKYVIPTSFKPILR